MVTKESKRIFLFDFLRIISACAVVMIHISADFIKDFDVGTSEFLWGNVFSALSRFAVPIFLMISGALMLDEDKNLSTKKIIKYAVNILILTFSWSFLYTIGYNVIKPIVFNEAISVSDILNTFFNGHYHMWYLYVLVGLYLVTPLLRFFVKVENSTLIRNYLLFSSIICFVCSFANEIINRQFKQEDILTNFISNFNFNYIYQYLIYYILGWYIVKVGFKITTRIILYIGGIAGLITTFVGTHFSFKPENDSYFISNDSLNIFLYSLAIFVFVHYFFKSKNIVLNKVWLKISSLTFGVYLIHCIYLFALKLICENIGFAILEIIIIFVSSIILSFLTAFVMSKIPFIKALVRG